MSATDFCKKLKALCDKYKVTYLHGPLTLDEEPNAYYTIGYNILSDGETSELKYEKHKSSKRSFK